MSDSGVLIASCESTKIGPYRIEKRIGEGAIAVVYRAVAPDGRRVAVKRLRPHRPEQELAQLERRFKREASLRIEHENVVHIIDADVDSHGVPYIVLELLEGESLDLRMARGRLSPEEVVHIGQQACRGLAAAHHRGVVHRDLKPANLFCCRNGTVKVLDFGMALCRESTRLTRQQMLVGTPAYLSPEQARGDAEIDVQSDIWALGAILYEALAGQQPFDRSSVLSTIVAIRRDPLTPLSRWVPSVPPALALVIERALDKSKQVRWTSSEAFHDALGRASLEPEEPSRNGGEAVTQPQRRVMAILLGRGIHDRARAEAAIRKEHGEVHPLPGDRLMGLFGARSWQGEEPLAAARAGLALRGAVESAALVVGRIKIGPNGPSGPGLAAALACLSPGASGPSGVVGVVVDEPTAQVLGARFALREVSGSQAELVGTLPSDAESSHRPESELLGRDAELALIERALRTVGEERRALAVLILANPGEGKSRLLDEVAARAERWSPAAQILTIRNAPGPLGLSEWLSPRQAWLRWLTPQLSKVAGGPRSSAAVPGDRPTDPIEALVRGVEAACKVGTAVLLLDDLDRFDTDRLDAVEELFERVAEMPVLVVLAGRTELADRRSDLLTGGEVLHVELRGLPRHDVARLAADILPDALTSAMSRRLTELTLGNPAFVLAICTQMAAQRWDGGADGPLPVPPIVEATVQSRLDQLPDAAFQLCCMATILGRDFFAEEIAALGLHNVESVLALLCRHDILVARGHSRRRRGRRYRFKSPLTALVVEQMLGLALRIALHRRAATCLAVLPDIDPAEVTHHSECAHRLERTGDAPPLPAPPKIGAGVALRLAQNHAI